jgi:hypothetical protein
MNDFVLENNLLLLIVIMVQGIHAAKHCCDLQGMISFSMEDVKLKCVSTGVRLRCSGRLCGGMYGDGGKCPRVKVAALPRYCVDLRLAVIRKRRRNCGFEMPKPSVCGANRRTCWFRGARGNSDRRNFVSFIGVNNV